MNPFLASVRATIEEVADELKLTEDAKDMLLEPKKSVEVTFSVRMDDGNYRVFKGWRVQHNDALGPHKGGIRFAPQVDREEVTALATTMSIKNAALALPYGGAKGGVLVSPWELSTRELEGVARGYVDALFKEIGPNYDVPAPDVNTNAMVIGWMMDEYSKLAQHTVTASFTGKPLVLGGTQLREAATGYGGYVILREMLKRMKCEKEPNDTRVVVQGFGNVGSTIAEILDEEGYKVIAVSDSAGGLYLESGLDIKSIKQAQEKAGTIKHNLCYPKSLSETDVTCEHIPHESFLEIETDILIPAAIESVLTKDNAPNIKASIVLEMANGGLDQDGEDVLLERGLTIIPDVIANGGGVASSYLEWVENREGRKWEVNESKEELDKLMVRALDEALKHQTDGRSFRQAAYVSAMLRMTEAMQARGWIAKQARS